MISLVINMYSSLFRVLTALYIPIAIMCFYIITAVLIHIIEYTKGG